MPSFNPVTVVQRDTAPKLGGNLDLNSFTILGMVLGVDIQAYDSELAAIAGLVSAANKLPYFTGSGTASLADLTSYARTLLDDSTAGAARTTLEITHGVWTPTYTNVANVASFGTVSDWAYLKIGTAATNGVMICAGRLSIDPTSMSTNTQFRQTLQTASALTLFTDIGGCFWAKGAVSLGGAILADVTNDEANFQYMNTLELAAQDMSGIYLARLK